jgi:hypothetical protein
MFKKVHYFLKYFHAKEFHRPQLCVVRFTTWQWFHDGVIKSNTTLMAYVYMYVLAMWCAILIDNVWVSDVSFIVCHS